MENSTYFCISVSIDFGDWLNKAFHMHKKERAENENTDSWKEWLKENVGISDRHARKLRQISFILVNYPHFRNVGLPLDDVCKHINEIENLLVTEKRS